MKTDDPAFRHIWKMMAADLALLLAEWLVPLTVFIIVLYGDEAVSSTVMIESDLDLYLLWTIRCLRLLTWLGMIVHLERLEGGFRSAKRWYLLRIFVFLTVQVLSVGQTLVSAADFCFFNGAGAFGRPNAGICCGFLFF